MFLKRTRTVNEQGVEMITAVGDASGKNDARADSLTLWDSIGELDDKASAVTRTVDPTGGLNLTTHLRRTK
jgi:hypothetical protein